MSHLFAYGLLIADSCMESVTGKNFESHPAILEGYSRYRIKGKEFPGIVREEKARVTGKLYVDVDEVSLLKLDAFESDYYGRVSVKVLSDDGSVVDAYTYVITEEHRHILSHEPWNFRKTDKTRLIFGHNRKTGADNS